MEDVHAVNRKKQPGAATEHFDTASMIPFILSHIVCLAAIWTGVHLADILLAVGLYVVRMFGITAGYHRYFSHRAYKTGRAFQFVLALLAQTSAQRGALWWAAHHRGHHRYSDTENDIHSPVRRSFLYSHMGWIFSDRHHATDLAAIPDFAKYPELVWLDRHPYLPAIMLGFLVWAAAGWSGLVVGFFWSTVALWHATFAINSLAHVYGSKRYLTGDESRNNWWLAILTLGEGWHNNHHHYQSAACQGFRRYEIDLSYYALKALALVGLVRDLKRPPRAVVMNEQRLGTGVVEKAAMALAESFDSARIAEDLRRYMTGKRAGIEESIDHLGHEMTDLLERWQNAMDRKIDTARHDIEELLAHVHLPAMPSAEELRERARAMYVRTPSMNEIVERARQILIDNLHRELVATPA